MLTLKICDDPTDWSQNVVNFADLNIPYTHLLIRQKQYKNLDIWFPVVDGEALQKLNPDISDMLKYFYVQYFNAKESQAPVNKMRPLFGSLYPKDILDFCCMKNYTISRMVHKYDLS